MAGRFRPFRPFPPILSSLALFLSLLFLCPPPRPMQEGPEPGSLGSWSIPYRAAPFLQCANAWYDTTSRREDMLGMNLPPLDKDIVPEKGVHYQKNRPCDTPHSPVNHIRLYSTRTGMGSRRFFWKCIRMLRSLATCLRSQDQLLEDQSPRMGDQFCG